MGGGGSCQTEVLFVKVEFYFIAMLLLGIDDFLECGGLLSHNLCFVRGGVILYVFTAITPTWVIC